VSTAKEAHSEENLNDRGEQIGLERGDGEGGLRDAQYVGEDRRLTGERRVKDGVREAPREHKGLPLEKSVEEPQAPEEELDATARECHDALQHERGVGPTPRRADPTPGGSS
jgi:hypothetical protein